MRSPIDVIPGTVVRELSVLLAALVVSCSNGPTRVKPLVPVDLPLDLSPDGNAIAYVHYETPGQALGIYLKALDRDSVPHLLMNYDPTRADPSRLRFSPDGKMAALVRDGYYDIDVLDLGTSKTTRVTFTNGNAQNPDWDPSGRYIVYERPFRDYDKPDTSAGLYIVDRQLLSDRPLLQGTKPTYGGWANWSPDSAIIVFAYGSPTHIYAINVDGSGRRDLTPGDTHWNEQPVWGDANGSVILFESWGPRRSNRKTRAISFPSGQLRDWSPDIRPYGSISVISRNSATFVFGGPDPTGRYIVLFAQRLDDKAGTSRRQVTFSIP